MVKQGRSIQGGELLAPAVQALLDRGAAAVILACTETPVALDATGSALRERCVDSNRALARACVARWLGRSGMGDDQSAALRSA
jgi:aspartate racemase